MKTFPKFNLDTQSSEEAARREAMCVGKRWYDLGYIGFLLSAAAAIAAGMLS